MTPRKEFFLSALRRATCCARMITTELDSIGVALKASFIDEDQALEWVREIGAFELLGHLPPGHITGEPEGGGK